MIPRRTFLRGLGALLMAPAIVRVGSIMPVRAVETRAFAYLIEADVEAWGRSGPMRFTLSQDLWDIFREPSGGRCMKLDGRSQVRRVAVLPEDECLALISRPSPPSVL